MHPKPCSLLWIVFVPVSCQIAVGQLASAAVITYTDRATWEAAIGGSPDILVDFNGVSADVSFLGIPFDAGPFSLLGGSIEFNFVDAAPFEGGGQWALDTTTYVLADVDVAEEVEMAIDTTVSAWGADFSKVDAGGLDLILTSDVGTTVIPVPNIPATGFFGFLTSGPESISSITFVGRTGGEAFGMDDVALVQFSDCNSNGVPDDDDIAAGTSPDCNTSGIPDECEPSPWLYFNGHFYIPSASGTWDETEAQAVAAGAHLVTINDAAENEWLYDTFFSAMSDAGVWIGFYQDVNAASYSEPTGGWVWISGELVTFVGWSGQEPNNQGGGENWASLEKSPHCCEWNDLGPTSAGYPVGGLPGVIEAFDCNTNGIPDGCDIDCGSACGICDTSGCGQSPDCNTNGVPDECESDFDTDGLIDDCDPDIDNDGINNAPDVCDFTPMSAILNGRVTLDSASSLYGTVRGDYDDDCDCDLADYSGFMLDFTGATASP